MLVVNIYLKASKKVEKNRKYPPNYADSIGHISDKKL